MDTQQERGMRNEPSHLDSTPGDNEHLLNISMPNRIVDKIFLSDARTNGPTEHQSNTMVLWTTIRLTFFMSVLWLVSFSSSSALKFECDLKGLLSFNLNTIICLLIFYSGSMTCLSGFGLKDPSLFWAVDPKLLLGYRGEQQKVSLVSSSRKRAAWTKITKDSDWDGVVVYIEHFGETRVH